MLTSRPMVLPVFHEADPGEALTAEIEAACPDEIALLWISLCKRLSLSSWERSLLALLVILDVDIDLSRAWRFAWASYAQEGLPWGFAVKLLSGNDDTDAVARSLDSSHSSLFKLGLLRLHPRRPDSPLAAHSISIPHDVGRALLGWHGATPEWLQGDSIDPLPKRIQPLVKHRLKVLERDAKDPLRVALQGPSGGGQQAVARYLSDRLVGLHDLWILDVSHIAASKPYDMAPVHRAIRMATLLDATLFVDGLKDGDKQTDSLNHQIIQLLVSTPQPVIYSLDGSPPDSLNIPANAYLQLGYPNRTERLQCWQTHLGGALASPQIKQLAGQFLLAEGQIDHVARQSLSLDLPPHQLLPYLEKEARTAASLGLGRLATPEVGRVTLDDLVVESETSDALQHIINYIRHRHELQEQWGFADQHSHGLGVTALFAGPPGTGKTLAALVVANALQLELYRVDLSQLVSKYIGETEKQLSKLFDAADAGEVMLLFDEADSLFSKRTEVKSSTDRYANLEVNYLLQRVERFDGVVILTTNFEAGIDDAFLRRIRFHVPFEIPDFESRLRLWNILLPEKTPVDEDLDLEVFAKIYELSGGHIKEIIIRAASTAFSEENLLTFDHIVRSANLEYLKIGRILPQIY